MKNNPCEMCIVRACCKIPKYFIWWKCGCDSYEMYRIWKSIYSYCGNNKKIAYLMINNNPRMQYLKERQQ